VRDMDKDSRAGEEGVMNSNDDCCPDGEVLEEEDVGDEVSSGVGGGFGVEVVDEEEFRRLPYGTTLFLL